MSDKLSLDGLWDFTFADGQNMKLPVPGCFDTVPSLRFCKGKGTYTRTVVCGNMVELSCDGLGLRAEIFWDGKLIYQELTAYTPFKVRFDAGNSGEHELKVVCDNTIEDTPQSEFRSFYDFYGFGGIYRSITLRELPETYFDYVKIIPDIDRGSIDLEVSCGGDEQEITVIIDGVVCGKLPGSGRKSFRVPQPELWSPETPHLHKLQLICNQDRYECRFGLRKIESRDGKILLNGQPLKLVGVNRHDVLPDTGSTVSKEQLFRDLQMIKQAGFNLIRGSHYPQSQMMLDIADELGILVWDEILAWGNPLDSLTDAEFQKRQSNALSRMIKSSVNHPSIVIWGFLNEAATNEPEARECVEKLYQLAKELDDSRLVTFASMHGEKDLCLDLVDVISFNTYPGWYFGNSMFFESQEVSNQFDLLHSFVAGKKSLADKPVLISEIGAASLIGDHSGRRWSEEYQAQLVECVVKNVLKDEKFAGICLWQFCNTPVDNSKILGRPRGYNNKGLLDEYRIPKAAWKIFPGILTAGNAEKR